MTDENKKVFFLGAGFSKAICPEYPLLKDLTKEVLESLKNDPLNLFGKGDEKASVKQHFTEIPQKLTNNIEELLTYLSSDLPWKDERKKALNRALYIDITNKITEHFQKLENTNSNIQTPSVILSEQSEREDLKDYKGKLSSYIFENNIPCITLNYDLLLETILSHSNINIDEKNEYSNFYKMPIQKIEDRNRGAFGFDESEDKKAFPEILKLHGSINWLYSGTNSPDPLFRSKGKDNEDLIGDLIPYIIPPVLDKNSFYNHNILKYLWFKAHNYLKQAKEIYIIGFSFPQTDLPIKFLFQSALRGREEDVQIFVINKTSSKRTYEEFFKDFKNVNYNYCVDDDPLDKFINSMPNQ